MSKQKTMGLSDDIKFLSIFDKIQLLFIKKQIVIDRNPKTGRGIYLSYKEHNGHIYIYDYNCV
jgi:hypothetical protein